MKRWRRAAAGLLILTGCALIVRGGDHALRGGGGWQALLTSLVIGGLIIALGAARLRFWGEQHQPSRTDSEKS